MLDGHLSHLPGPLGSVEKTIAIVTITGLNERKIFNVNCEYCSSIVVTITTAITKH